MTRRKDLYGAPKGAPLQNAWQMPFFSSLFSRAARGPMKTWALAPEGDDVETDALCSDFFVEFLGHDTRACFKNRFIASGLFPQGLKPRFYTGRNGTAEAVPFQRTIFETRSSSFL